MPDVDSGLPGDLQDDVGEGLRAVATYEQVGYEFQYLRTDVQSRYTRGEMERILEDLVMEGIAKDYVESLFHAGDLQCAIYGFEEAAMFHFVVDEFDGVFVSIDREVDIDLNAVISTVRAAVEA